MDPWKIIGWIALGIMALVVIRWVLLTLIGFIGAAVIGRKAHNRWKATKDTPPAAGQRWRQGDRILKITNVYPNGNIGIESGNASWGESPADWKKRVENRKLTLIQ